MLNVMVDVRMLSLHTDGDQANECEHQTEAQYDDLGEAQADDIIANRSEFDSCIGTEDEKAKNEEGNGDESEKENWCASFLGVAASFEQHDDDRRDDDF